MERTREIQKALSRLLPPDARDNARVRPPEARRHWAVYRVEFADGLDIHALCDAFPDARVHLRDAPRSGACVELSVPVSAVNTHSLRMLERACVAASAACAAIAASGFLFL